MMVILILKQQWSYSFFLKSKQQQAKNNQFYTVTHDWGVKPNESTLIIMLQVQLLFINKSSSLNYHKNLLMIEDTGDWKNQVQNNQVVYRRYMVNICLGHWFPNTGLRHWC